MKLKLLAEFVLLGLICLFLGGIVVNEYNKKNTPSEKQVKPDINAVMANIQKIGKDACDKIDGILIGGIEAQVDIETGATTLGGGYYCFNKSLFKGRSI